MYSCISTPDVSPNVRVVVCPAEYLFTQITKASDMLCLASTAKQQAHHRSTLSSCAHMCRFFIIWHSGGVYHDVDVECFAAVEQWAPSECRLALHMELFQRQWAQYVFAAAPRHALLARVLRKLEHKVLHTNIDVGQLDHSGVLQVRSARYKASACQDVLFVSHNMSTWQPQLHPVKCKHSQAVQHPRWSLSSRCAVCGPRNVHQGGIRLASERVWHSPTCTAGCGQFVPKHFVPLA